AIPPAANLWSANKKKLPRCGLAERVIAVVGVSNFFFLEMAAQLAATADGVIGLSVDWLRTLGLRSSA
ncbi:hypothetical protein, partial [Paenibacillus gorillae]|uniref:hypothetical protein n=1 Tax=Paenibacillus gorillae TaxID=1243662 RepID=UPI0005A8FD47